ncbi:hypothetical protein THAOC_31863 [Thalassiosira oceanica]|uniref:Uncharacterized protein n=1 Tax=Thalassiosira oceanica TaxID=159749 RepID=K0RRL5_THAOC|nr:hypothetical protein THAOC_31863 [Thalassiosira oceanica]|eukprot:EJK49282.1 hypothetical protein THAOC_31863 [Thalassiosira oceanica]
MAVGAGRGSRALDHDAKLLRPADHISNTLIRHHQAGGRADCIAIWHCPKDTSIAVSQSSAPVSSRDVYLFLVVASPAFGTHDAVGVIGGVPPPPHDRRVRELMADATDATFTAAGRVSRLTRGAVAVASRHGLTPHQASPTRGCPAVDPKWSRVKGRDDMA